jgi:hypothetical protein
MAVPSAYLASTKNTRSILEAAQRAGVPERFTFEFMKQIGYGSSGDRPMIPVLKSIGFLTESGQPTDRYRRYKDPATAQAAMAEGLREAYADLFGIDTDAHTKSVGELKGMFSRLSDKGESVNSKMAATFKALAELADFRISGSPFAASSDGNTSSKVEVASPPANPPSNGGVLSLRHDIHIHLPASTDIAVFNAIFRALKETLSA